MGKFSIRIFGNFLESFRLPGESPIVERILGSFSKHWLVSILQYTPVYSSILQYTPVYSSILLYTIVYLMCPPVPPIYTLLYSTHTHTHTHTHTYTHTHTHTLFLIYMDTLMSQIEDMRKKRKQAWVPVFVV